MTRIFRVLTASAFALIILSVGPLANAQSSYTWNGNGGDNNFGTGANWVGGNAPSSLQSYLNFAGTNRLTPNNNYGDYGPGYQIYFNSGAGAFTITGNHIKFYNFGGGGGTFPGDPNIENDSTNTQTINFGFGLGSGQSGAMHLYANTGDLTFGASSGNNFSYFDDSGLYLALKANAGRTITFWGSLGDGGATAKVSLDGGGNVVFNAANTYTGETDINNGKITVNVAPTGTSGTYYVGNGAQTGNSASLLLGNGSTGGLSFGNAMIENVGSSSNRIIGGSNTGGTNTFTNTLTLGDSNANLVAATGGTVAFNTITSASQNTVTVGGNSNNGTVQLNGTVDNTNLGVTVNSGTLLLAKTSSSSVHAVGSGLTVNGGTAQLGGSGGDQIFNSSAVTVSGGTFAIGGNSETVGTVTLTSGSITGSGGTLTGSSYGVQSGSVSAILGGSGITLTKSTSGTVILSGANTYTGATTINAGTLQVDGSITSAVTVNNTGKLAGSGTTGAVSVASGGTLSPGASPGILNTGNLSLALGSTYLVDINGTAVGTQYDQTNVTGTVSLAGTLTLNLGFSPAAGNSFTIINNDGADAVTGTFNGLAEGATISGLTITYHGGDGNDVVLSSPTAVPEPSTWFAAAMSLGTIAFSQRRRLATLVGAK